MGILIFQAVDQDVKKSVRYFIKEDSTGKFAVDENTGKLTTRQELDYEKKNSYKLIVSTREASGKNNVQYSATVSVIVLVRSCLCHHVYVQDIIISVIVQVNQSTGDTFLSL